MATKKNQKQDPKLVSANDKGESEIKYIAKAYKVPISVVRKTRKEHGRSRLKIYAALRLIGYSIKTKSFPNG